jgi:hypothetical protein
MRAELYKDVLEFNPHDTWMTSQAMTEFFADLIEFGQKQLGQPVEDIVAIQRLLGSYDATVLMMTGMMEYLFSNVYILQDETTDYNVIDDYLAQHPDLAAEDRDWLTGLRQSYLGIYTVAALTDTTVTLTDAILTDHTTPITVTLDDQFDQLTLNDPIACRLVHLPDEQVKMSFCWMPLNPFIAEDAIATARQLYNGMHAMATEAGTDMTPEQANITAKGLWASLILGQWMVYVAMSHQVNQEETRDAERQKRKAHNILSAVTGKP